MMKLYITAPSPFARKCRIVAREKGLRVEEIFADPYSNAPEILAANPVAQVPVLIARDGQPITDSPFICEYLDDIGEGPRLLPASGPERLAVRRLETTAGAALEMGVKLVLEKRRPEAERSPGWITRWTDNMARALDVLDATVPDDGPLNMGVITAGVAVAWIGFRHPGFDLSGRDRLLKLAADLETRPSFIATRPE